MITLLSDYGHEGPYVGVCHGVIRQIVPSAPIIDVSHSIEPYDVLQGSLVLDDAIPFLPIGVHVAVVDPEVGTERRALALACADGRRYVGPDNGLLMRAAERSGLERAVELREERGSSVTFDGRDIFAPAAARLADSVALELLGEPVEPDSLQRLPLPAPMPDGESLRVLITASDRFGTVQLACSLDQLDAAVGPGPLVVSSDLESVCATRAATFSDVGLGEGLLYVDSFAHLALAIRRGSARARLGVRAGDWLSLRAV